STLLGDAQVRLTRAFIISGKLPTLCRPITKGLLVCVLQLTEPRCARKKPIALRVLHTALRRRLVWRAALPLLPPRPSWAMSSNSWQQAVRADRADRVA